MSLTTHLKNIESPINKMFKENFININEFIKSENKKIEFLNVILPEQQLDYPWSTIGHVTEYLLALQLGLPIYKLFPMGYLKEFDYKNYKNIKDFNIIANDLDNENKTKIIYQNLYNLAVFEDKLRTKGYDAKFIKKSLPSIVYKDIKNIYENSLKKFPDGIYGYNPTFNENITNYIGGADADLIKYKENGNFLIDIKTTKNNKIEKQWIFQLLGYVALDIDNKYNFKTMGIYLSRQNKTLEYSIEEIIKNYSSYTSVQEFKELFKNVVFTHYEKSKNIKI